MTNLYDASKRSKGPYEPAKIRIKSPKHPADKRRTDSIYSLAKADSFDSLEQTERCFLALADTDVS